MAHTPKHASRRSPRRALGLAACAAALAIGTRAHAAEAPPSLAAGRQALKEKLDALLGQPPLSSARVAVEVTSLEDGQVVYARRSDELLNPASNTKLITAAAALLRLGPEFRFSTEFRTDGRYPKGRIKNLYVKGGGDPTINTERLQGLAADLWHRGVRSIEGDLVLDDRYFDEEAWGPGWEQETSDKSYAAPVGALSLNHNSVGIYVFPADRRGAKARVEVEPESRYFSVETKIQTVRSGGRRRAKVNTLAGSDQTRVVVRGRLPAGNRGLVLYRRVYDPTRYFGETLRAILIQRGIKVSGRVRRAPAPDSADTIATYESPELAEIVRDMNKVSSNFIAEMLLKTLGAEVRGTPGTWKKGVEVAEELLSELGLPRGSYVLKNGSGLNDTNRFTAHQISILLASVWRRFPVMAEFVSSLGIAARDGTLRLRMEGTEAAGRLRAKTGTLEHVTALSGYVASVGGERFAFSIMVNDWTGRASPVVHTVDRLGGLIASAGSPLLGPREEALAQLAAAHGDQARPAELRARFATYNSLAKSGEKKNLAFLRSALRTERDPILRLAAADALYQSDPDQGGTTLLEALPATPELFVKLRDLGKELSLPVPVVSSLLDLASDGSTEAIGRLLALAPMAQGGQGDDLRQTLSDGLLEVGHNAPEELLAALHAAPADQSQATLELLGFGLAMAAEDVTTLEIAEALRNETGSNAPRAQGWLALLQRRVLPGSAPAGDPAPNSSLTAAASPASAAAAASALATASTAASPASAGPSAAASTAAASLAQAPAAAAATSATASAASNASPNQPPVPAVAAPAGRAPPGAGAIASALTASEPITAKGDQAADADEDDDLQVPKSGATSAAASASRAAAAVSITNASAASAGSAGAESASADPTGRNAPAARADAATVLRIEPTTITVDRAKVDEAARAKAAAVAAAAAATNANPASAASAAPGTPTAPAPASPSAPSGAPAPAGSVPAKASSSQPQVIPASTTEVVTSGLVPEAHKAAPAAAPGKNSSAAQAPAKAR